MEETLKKRLERDSLFLSKMVRSFAPFVRIVARFMEARRLHKKFEFLYAKNRRILGKNFYVKNN